MPIPSVVKGYNVFVQGRSYAGKANCSLPGLKVMTEKHIAGGMSGEVEIDMGAVESINVEFTLFDYEPTIIRNWGLIDGNAVTVVLRAAKQDDTGGAPVAIKATVRGQFHEIDMGGLEAGKKNEMKCKINARSYKLEIGGETVIHVDAELMIRVVGGVDQMASLRGVIGL